MMYWEQAVIMGVHNYIVFYWEQADMLGVHNYILLGTG
jgi:hypothetical protein